MACGLNIEQVNCKLLALRAEFDAAEAVDQAIQESIESIYGAGTNYTVTDTEAAVNLGTTDPVVTLGVAGTYLLLSSVQVEYVAATVVAQTLALYLRRTNNTPATVDNTLTIIDLPASTTLTHTYGIVQFHPVLYTTANDDDAVTIFAGVSAALGAGTIQISDATIVAVRLY